MKYKTELDKTFDERKVYVLLFNTRHVIHIPSFRVCVCVCLRANHLDVVRLGVKGDQDLPCVRHYIPRSNGKPL